MSLEMINAIAGLWKLVAPAFLLVAVIMFRQQIIGVLERLSRFRFRRGQTEILVEGTSKQPKTPTIGEPGRVASAETPQADESETKALPTPEDPRELFSQMIHNFIDGKFDEAKQAFDRMQESETDETRKIYNQTTYYAFRYKYTLETSAMEELEKLAEKPEHRAYVKSWIANCHKGNKSFQEAEIALNQAIEASRSEEERARHLASIARLKRDMGVPKEGLQLLVETLGKDTSRQGKVSLLRALESLYLTLEDKVNRALVLEKLVELEPDDNRLKFDAAYAQSEAKLSHLCVANYDTLVRADPKYSSAINNLGVEAKRLNMPISSVRYYKMAVDNDETLAMSNLAYLYLYEGFLDEASQLLETARHKDDVHPNVGEALSRVSERKNAEQKKWENALRMAIRQKLFFQKYVDALFERAGGLETFKGSWTAEDGVPVVVELTGKSIAAEWGEGNSRRRWEATTRGRTAEGKFKKWQISLFGTQGYFDSGEDAFAYITQDGKNLFMVVNSVESPELLHFKRSEEGAAGDT